MRSFFVAGLLLVAIAFAVSVLNGQSEKSLIITIVIAGSIWIQCELWQEKVIVNLNREREIRYNGYLLSFVISIVLSGATMIGAMIIYGFRNTSVLLLCSAGGCSFIPGIVAAFGMYRTRDG